MPREWTPAVETAIAEDTLNIAWLLELETVEGWLRSTDRDVALTYDSNPFEAAHHTWEVQGEINSGANLVPEPITLKFDGADQYDSTSILARLIARTWHQRQIILRGILLNETSVIGQFIEWRGRMDMLDFTTKTQSEAIAVMSCEGGTFKVLDRNHSTVSDADQRRRNPDDAFFKNQAKRVGQRMPFGTKSVAIPGSTSGSDFSSVSSGGYINYIR